MKILLLGEYSGLHLTLAEGLKLLGHDVLLVSDGDGFKNYFRDIDIRRKGSGFADTLSNLNQIYSNLKSFKGFEIVQIINPNFTNQNVRVNLFLYHFLKKHNSKVFLGAFGDDYFWIKTCLDQKYRYSEFFFNGKETNIAHSLRLKKQWIGTQRQQANIEIAESCDGIIACLYEYYAAYKPNYAPKLTYIPLPINTDKVQPLDFPAADKIRYFVGINNPRSQFKGTDLLYRAAQQLHAEYPNEMELIKVESVTYEQYLKQIASAHVVLDQIYSYSPAMNGLLTLALNKILISGGEPEMYNLLNEEANRPIVNVLPSEQDIYSKLKNILSNKASLKQQAANGRLFVQIHHNYLKVAQQYLDFWHKMS